MGLGAIPHESHRGVKMAAEVLHEYEDRVGIEVLLDEQLKIQTHRLAVWADTECGDHRYLPAVPQHRSLPRRPQVRRTTGSRSRPLSSMKTSQALARRVGRCGLHPRERSRRPM
jgi:hypothetical protein